MIHLNCVQGILVHQKQIFKQALCLSLVNRADGKPTTGL